MLAPCCEVQAQMLQNESDLLILGGSAGSMKSFSLHLIVCKYLDCPNFKATFIRRTVPMLMKPGNLWDTGKKVFSQLPDSMIPTWREGDRKLVRWKHGPVIEYSYLQHDKDLDNYQGSQMTVFAIDEAVQLEWNHLTYLFSRMRSDSKYKSRCLWSCNPEKDHMIRNMVDFWIDDDGFPIREKNGTERYFYVVDGYPQTADTEEELIEKYPHIAEGPDGTIIKPMSYSFISASVYDNKPLLKSNPGYLSALKGLEESERLKLLDGNWDVVVKGTNYFQRENLNKLDKIPLDACCCRAWDKASAIPTEAERYPDYTASIKLYKTPNGEFVIAGEYHPDNHDDWDVDLYGFFRAKPGKRNTIIQKQSLYDGEDCICVLPQDPGSAGISEFQESARQLALYGIIVKKDPSASNKSKLMKFTPVAAAIENGLVGIVESTFPKKTLEYFYKELESFDGTRSTRQRKDESVDILATAYNYLSKSIVIPKFTLPSSGVNTNIRKLKTQISA